MVLSVVMDRTLKGFEIKVIGAAPRAGGFAGFSANRTVWFCFLLSGALAGVAGLCEVAGPSGHLQPVVSPGYGFTAIIVAFLGRQPVGGGARRGGPGAQLSRRRGAPMTSASRQDHPSGQGICCSSFSPTTP